MTSLEFRTERLTVGLSHAAQEKKEEECLVRIHRGHAYLGIDDHLPAIRKLVN